MMSFFKKGNLIKATAVTLAVCMLAVGCSSASGGNTVVAKVNDVKITYDQFKAELDRMLQQYGIQDTPENAENVKFLKEGLLDMMIDKEVYTKLEEEMGIKPTEEDIAAAKAEAELWKEQNLQYLITTYTQQGNADPEKAAKEYLDKYMTDNKLDMDYLEKEFLGEAMYKKLFEQITKDITVTDEEVRKQYDTNVADEKKSFEADKSAFEADKQAGVPVYYTPEGVYYVKHILLEVSDEEKEEISKLRYTDKKDAEADAARDKALAKIKDKADAALKRVQAGEDFQKLIDELGQDPGMTTSPTKDTGYMMYEGCKTYVPEFTEASVLLKKDGDVSGLVATDYGYHIIKRVSTLTAGATPFEEVSERLKSEMMTKKQNDAFTAAVDKWKSENKVESFKDKL